MLECPGCTGELGRFISAVHSTSAGEREKKKPVESSWHMQHTGGRLFFVFL